MKKNILVVFWLLSFVLKAHFLSAQPNGGWLRIKVFNKGEELKFCPSEVVPATVVTQKNDSLNTISISCYESLNHKRYRTCSSLICSSWDGLFLSMDMVTDYKLVLTSRTGKEKMIILFNGISSMGCRISIDFKPGVFRTDGAKIEFRTPDITPADWESARIKRANRWYQRKPERKFRRTQKDK
ncbi:MAG TPA: hypothetical protein VK826_07440 [Bacteroidia bacterium]|nr:hypothetical protein [Bacteroidia bacterium]